MLPLHPLTLILLTFSFLCPITPIPSFTSSFLTELSTWNCNLNVLQSRREHSLMWPAQPSAGVFFQKKLQTTLTKVPKKTPNQNPQTKIQTNQPTKKNPNSTHTELTSEERCCSVVARYSRNTLKPSQISRKTQPTL